MKRLLVLLLALIMCLSLSACKKETAIIKEEIEAQLEQTVHELIERNLDCYILFYVASLSHTTQQNSDGYYGTDGGYFADYAELEELVRSTYIEETATKLLNHPSADTPLYKDVAGEIFTKPDVVTFADYEINWDDSYELAFTEISDTKCSFTITTTDFYSNEYKTQGTMVLENGNWLLEDLVY